MLLPYFLNMSSSDPLILNQADWWLNLLCWVASVNHNHFRPARGDANANGPGSFSHSAAVSVPRGSAPLRWSIHCPAALPAFRLARWPRKTACIRRTAQECRTSMLYTSKWHKMIGGSSWLINSTWCHASSQEHPTNESRSPAVMCKCPAFTI